MIGSPVFGKIKLSLPNGRAFTIRTVNNSSKNKYVQSARLNGSPLNVPYITYRQMVAGGSLEFLMGPVPSRWASDWRGTPLSSSK
jgi:putative alpha-1,2-mannosidase